MKKITLLTLLLSSLFSKEPHYDIGLGTVIVGYPSYMGSKTDKLIVTPVPYLNYEGEKTTITRGNIERKLFDLKDLTLDISLGGSLPADSEHSKVREGMEDLNLAFEIGPRLKYRLYHQDNHQLFFRVPIRAVMTTDFQGVAYQGYLITPDINYEYTRNELKITLKTGPLWASEAYHDYFYSVQPQYVTATRPEYQAKAGYNGYRNSVGIKYKQGDWVYGGFAAHFNLNGAVFADSPLVETRSALFTGAYLSYIFYSR